MGDINYNRIKAAIVEGGSTNKAVAEYLGVTEETVSRWCTNTTQPTIPTMYLIAKFLKIDIRNLLVSTKW